jgi:hypothetical protein
MHEQRGKAPLPAWLAVVALRAAVTAIVVATGFHAVSDDDFARVVIAQGFAFTPALDPSGTSWLPFPFWLTGSVMTLLGTSIAVARALSWATSLASAALVYVAGRWVGWKRNPAVLGAALAAVLPHAVWLGAATVPEGYSATLCLLAIASHSGLHEKRRWLGVLAITCAALSRYEAWPVATLLAAFGAYDAFVQRDLRWLGPAACALFGPLWWLAHGVVRHDDALFFLRRVADYRRALGRSPVDVLHALFDYPKVLLRAEPELTAALLIALVPARARRCLQGSARLVLGGAVVLVFLVLGDLGDGAPTHHPERPLLVVWLIACVLLGQALLRGFTDRRWLGVLGVAVLTALLLRPMVTRRDDFVDRSAELAIGRLSQGPVGSGRLVVDTDDYGFFAVMAGFERVEQCQPLREHDPRKSTSDPWRSTQALRARLAALGANFLIAGRDKLPKLLGLGPVVQATADYVLLRLPESATSSPARPSAD